MKYIPNETIGPIQLPVIELTRRNLEVLLAKLDNPESRKTLIDPEYEVAVRAVEDDEHYADRAPGATKEEIDAYIARVAEQAKNAAKIGRAFLDTMGPPK